MDISGQNLKSAGSYAGGAAMLGVGAGTYDGLRNAAVPQEIRQSDVEAQVQRLLNTAEVLEKCVAVLVGRIEKVTAQDPKTEGKSEKLNPPVPSTILGRDLAHINGCIQNSISTLQATIQRIEL